MNVLRSRSVVAFSSVSTLVFGSFFACAESDGRPPSEDPPPSPDAQTLPDSTSPEDAGASPDAPDASSDAARCSKDGFCFEPVPVHKPLFAVSGTSIDDAWTVASDTLLRWDGVAWETAYKFQGTDPGFFWISARKHDDVWAIGNQTLVRYSSRAGGAPTFRDYRSGFKGSNGNTPSYWVDPTSTELWIVTGFSGVPSAYRYRETPEGTLQEDRITDPAIGLPWTQSNATFLPQSIFGFAADDIYVGGAWCTSDYSSFYDWAAFDGAIAHYDGTSWSMVATLGKGELVSMIHGTEAADKTRRLWVWTGLDGLAGSQHSLRLLSLSEDGGAPTTLFNQSVRLDTRRGHPFSGSWGTGCHHIIGSTVLPSGGAWFSDVCMVYRWNGTSLDVPTTLTYGIPAGTINGIWAANEDEAWIVGEAARRNQNDPATGFAAKRMRVAP